MSAKELNLRAGYHQRCGGTRHVHAGAVATRREPQISRSLRARVNMAGDWIKWCKGFSRKEEVLSISRKLNLNRRIVASACMELFEWADSETVDGHIRGTDTAFVDELVGLPGFASAIEGEKWVRFTTTGISFLNWDRHNGETAKRRIQDAARKKERRSGCPENVRKMSASQPDISAATSSLLLSSGSVSSSEEGGVGEARQEPPPGQIRPDPNRGRKPLGWECWPDGLRRAWEAYPGHRRGSASDWFKVWTNRELEPIAADVVRSIEGWKLSKQWSEGIIPLGETFIRQERYTGDVPPDAAAKVRVAEAKALRTRLFNVARLGGVQEARAGEMADDAIKRRMFTPEELAGTDEQVLELWKARTGATG